MSKIHPWGVCLAVVVLVLGSGVTLTAQLTRGFVSGRITDATDAVLPGVQITIVNKATNIFRETTSRDAGFFRFVAVDPGTYSVEFRLDGFATTRIEGVAVGPAQEVVLNQVMVIAPQKTDLIVTPAGTVIAKADPTIACTLPERVVQDLPLTAATRDVTRLAFLAPTVTRAPGSNEFTANGQRARNNNFMLDGTDNNDLSITQTSSRIIPEAVGEFQIQTSSYSAEFGRSSGAQISIITRSGSNKFHGEGWDYYRGNWMEPLALLNKRASLTSTPWYVANQGGGDLGGPIISTRQTKPTGPCQQFAIWTPVGGCANGYGAEPRAQPHTQFRKSMGKRNESGLHSPKLGLSRK